MRVNIHSVISLMLALASPVLGLFFSIASMIGRRPVSYVGFSLSLSLIYSYLPTLWDAAQIFSDLHIYNWTANGIYVSALRYIGDIPGSSYTTATFSIAFFIIYVQSKILMDAGRVNVKSNQNYIIFVLLVLSTFEYRNLFDIQRTSLAAAFLLIGVSSNRFIVRMMFFAISGFVHVFFISFILLITLANVYDLRSRKASWALLLALTAISLSFIFKTGILASILSSIEFIPARAVGYLEKNYSRFSPDIVTLVVRIMKMATLMVIASSLYKIDGEYTKDQRFVLNLTILSCLAALSVSFDEILMERFYTAIVILTIYAMGFVNFNKKQFLFVSLAILANSILHGASNFIIILSDYYSVMPDQDLRINMMLRPLYMPTILLIDHNHFGYSNEILSHNLRFRGE